MLWIGVHPAPFEKDTRNDVNRPSSFLESFHRERSRPAEAEPGPHGE